MTINICNDDSMKNWAYEYAITLNKRIQKIEEFLFIRFDHLTCAWWKLSTTSSKVEWQWIYKYLCIYNASFFSVI